MRSSKGGSVSSLDRSEPQQVIYWQDKKNTGAVGWIVIHNLINGIAGGGLFIHETATLQEVKDLAYTMSLKNSLQTPMFGGGKAGIRFAANHPACKGVLKRFLLDNLEVIQNKWCTGGDINTTTDEITYHLAENSEVKSPFICLATALEKNLKININPLKFQHRLATKENNYFTVEQAITGYGIFKTVESKLKNTKLKIIIQGFGKVGRAFCFYAKEHYDIVGICERDWFISNPNGINVESLLALNNEIDTETLLPYNPTYRLAEEDSEQFLIRFLQKNPADLFSPCAVRYCITENVLDCLVKHTFAGRYPGYIVAGANDIFRKNLLIKQAFASNITVIPEWVANSGAATLFIEALKYQGEQIEWIGFIKHQVASKIISFLDKAQDISRSYHLNIYEASCYLAETMLQPSNHQLIDAA